MARIKFYQDRHKEWRWTLFLGTRKVANSGEGYKRPSHARKMVAKLFPWFRPEAQ